MSRTSACLPLLLLVAACGGEPPGGSLAVLTARAPAIWIVPPAAARPSLHTAVELDSTFRTTFELAERPGTAVLKVRALRRATVRLNGRTIEMPAVGIPWREEGSVDVAADLVTGVNHLEVTVANAMGPPALWLALQWQGGAVATDGRWEVSTAGSTWRAAAPARAPLRGRAFQSPEPDATLGAALRERWGTLAALVATVEP